MWFKCLKSDLFDALQDVFKAVSMRTTIPVLTGIYFKTEGQKLVLKATDLEITIIRELEVNEVESEEAVIPARTILDIVKSLDDGIVEFSVNKGENKVEIKSEKVNYEVKSFLSEDFPKIEKKTEEGALEIKVKKFKEGINQVIKSVSRDETRPALTGVLFEIGPEGYKLVATDGYRLSIRECKEKIKHAEPKKLIVIGRALEELGKLIKEEDKVAMHIGDSGVAWQTGNIQLQSRLIEGNFPDYTQLIPKESGTVVEIKKEAFQNALKRVKIVSAEEPIRLSVEDKKMLVFAESKEIGRAEETIEIKSEGEAVEIAFKASYLDEGVGAVTGKEVVLNIQDRLKPCLIKEKDSEEYLCVVMPLRVG